MNLLDTAKEIITSDLPIQYIVTEWCFKPDTYPVSYGPFTENALMQFLAENYPMTNDGYQVDISILTPLPK